MRQYMRRTTDGFMLSIVVDSCAWLISHGTIKDNHFVVTTHNHELLSVDLKELLELVKTAIARSSIA